MSKAERKLKTKSVEAELRPRPRKSGLKTIVKAKSPLTFRNTNSRTGRERSEKLKEGRQPSTGVQSDTSVNKVIPHLRLYQDKDNGPIIRLSEAGTAV